jgi:diacylglycerol kinase family enzyme
VNVLQQQGGTAALTVDGSPRQARFFNILVTNTAIYAGEFRFVAEDSAEDGCLDLHLFTDRFDYLRRYPAAWRRHVRYEQGLRVQVLEKERVRDLVIESEKPVTAQLDGEELQAARRFVVRVLPAALRLKVPVPSGR